MTTTLTPPPELPAQTPVQSLIEWVLNVSGKAVETEVDKHRTLLKIPDIETPSKLKAITYKSDVNYITVSLLIGEKPMTVELDGKRRHYMITYDDVEYRSVFHPTVISEEQLKEFFALIFYVKAVTDISNNYN